MCLSHDARLTKNYKRRKTPISAYKVCLIKNNQLCSPIMRSPIEIDPETLEFSTNSSIYARKYNNQEWEEGIHAFLDLKEAKCLKKYRESWGNPEIFEIFKVTIYPEDVLGVGEFKDIVAKRIYFDKDEVE